MHWRKSMSRSLRVGSMEWPSTPITRPKKVKKIKIKARAKVRAWSQP